MLRSGEAPLWYKHQARWKDSGGTNVEDGPDVTTCSGCMPFLHLAVVSVVPWRTALSASPPRSPSNSRCTMVAACGPQGGAVLHQLLEDAHHVGNGRILLVNQALRGEEELGHRSPLVAVHRVMHWLSKCSPRPPAAFSRGCLVAPSGHAGESWRLAWRHTHAASRGQCVVWRADLFVVQGWRVTLHVHPCVGPGGRCAGQAAPRAARRLSRDGA